MYLFNDKWEVDISEVNYNPDSVDNTVQPDIYVRICDDYSKTLLHRIDEYTEGAVRDNGYDYLDNDVMAIWLETEDAAGNVEKVIKLIESEEILENDLRKAAVVYISEEDCAELGQCQKVYPEN